MLIPIKKVDGEFCSENAKLLKESLKRMALPCVLLHNICISRGDLIPKSCDLSVQKNGERRTSEEIRGFTTGNADQNV